MKKKPFLFKLRLFLSFFVKRIKEDKKTRHFQIFLVSSIVLSLFFLIVQIGKSNGYFFEQERLFFENFQSIVLLCPSVENKTVSESGMKKVLNEFRLKNEVLQPAFLTYLKRLQVKCSKISDQVLSLIPLDSKDPWLKKAGFHSLKNSVLVTDKTEKHMNEKGCIFDGKMRLLRKSEEDENGEQKILSSSIFYLKNKKLYASIFFEETGTEYPLSKQAAETNESFFKEAADLLLSNRPFQFEDWGTTTIQGVILKEDVEKNVGEQAPLRGEDEKETCVGMHTNTFEGWSSLYRSIKGEKPGDKIHIPGKERLEMVGRVHAFYFRLSWMFVAALFIFVLFSALLNFVGMEVERRSEASLLKSLGFTDSDVFFASIMEGVFLWLSAVVLALSAGYLLGAVLCEPFIFPAKDVLFFLAVSLVTILVLSIWMGFQMKKIRPIP